MTVKEFYAISGGGYEDALKRLMRESFMIRFLHEFTVDPSMSQLNAAMEAEDYEQAFAAAHTLKGVTANLSLVSLNQLAVEITEMLRNGADIEGAKDMLPILQKSYDSVIEAIGQLED